MRPSPPPPAHGDEGILRRRAELLAAPPQAADGAAEDALEVGIGPQRLLLELRFVREVRPLPLVMPVPLAAPSVPGLVHLRGRLLPLMDLARVLGLPQGCDEGKRMLVLGRDRAELAYAIDSVCGLRVLAEAGIQRRSAALESLHPDLVGGITRDGSLLLDAGRLLAVRAARAPAPPLPFPTDLPGNHTRP